MAASIAGSSLLVFSTSLEGRCTGGLAIIGSLTPLMAWSVTGSTVKLLHSCSYLVRTPATNLPWFGTATVRDCGSWPTSSYWTEFELLASPAHNCGPLIPGVLRSGFAKMVLEEGFVKHFGGAWDKSSSFPPCLSFPLERSSDCYQPLVLFSCCLLV